MLAPGQRLVRLLQERGINARWADYPGGHVFSVWRNLLHESAPMLFQPRLDEGSRDDRETATRGGRRAGVRLVVLLNARRRRVRRPRRRRGERALGDDVGDGAAAGADASAVRSAASWCSRRRPPACRPR